MLDFLNITLQPPKENDTVSRLMEETIALLALASLPALNTLFKCFSKNTLNATIDIAPIPSDTKELKAALSPLGLRSDYFLVALQKMKEESKQADSSKMKSYTLQEAIENIIKKSNESLLTEYLPKVVLNYAELCDKLKALNSRIKESEIDSAKKIFNPFRPQYLSPSSRVEHEGDDLIYMLTDKLRENLNSTPNLKKSYLEIIHTIDEFYLNTENKVASAELVTKLKHLSSSYFSTLLNISIRENKISALKDEDVKKAREEFREKSLEEINIYKENYPKESMTILDKLLRLIAKLIPISINPARKSRIAFFDAFLNSSEKTKISLKQDRLVPKV